MKYRDILGYSKKQQPKKKVQKSNNNKILENIQEEFGYVNETIPRFAQEWKNLDKACYELEKAVKILEKSVSRQDRKGAKTISGLCKYTSNSIKKFKELISTEVLSKLQ